MFYSNDKEVVSTVQDLHDIGTFCNIIELQDVGDKLRMIVMAHRRIKVVSQIILDEGDGLSESSSESESQDKSRRRRKRRDRNNKTSTGQDENNNKPELPEVAEEAKNAVNGEEEDKAKSSFGSAAVLMIEIENVKHDKFSMTTEVKVNDLCRN